MRTLLDEPFSGLDITSEQQIATVAVTDRNITLLIQLSIGNADNIGGTDLDELVLE